MLRDFADIVRNLIGDSKVQKPSKKPADPLREALLAHGGRETSMRFIAEEGVDAWSLGFVVLVLKNGRVWKMPGDNLYAMYRDYLKLAELQGGSSIKDIVEGLGCAVGVFSFGDVRVHINRRSNRTVLNPVRELRSYIDEVNTRERAQHEQLDTLTKTMRKFIPWSFKVTAYEEDKVYRNAILR